MRKVEKIIEIKEEVKVGNIVLEVGDKIKILEGGNVDIRQVQDALEASLPIDIIQWFEGPRGFDNSVFNLNQIKDIYIQVITDIDPEEIFADY